MSEQHRPPARAPHRPAARRRGPQPRRPLRHRDGRRAAAHVAWVGSEGAADAFADGVDEVVDLDGALVTPAFTDAHVHTTATGLALTGLDLSGAPHPGRRPGPYPRVRRRPPRRPGPARPRLGRRPAGPSGRPPTRAELDEAAGGRPALPHPHRRALRRRHHRAPRPGPGRHRPAGLRRRRPAHRRRPPRRARAPRTPPSPPRQRAEAQRAALAHAASLGIGSVHECAGPDISAEDDFTGLLRARRRARPARGSSATGPSRDATPQDADRIRDLGAHRRRRRPLRRRLPRLAHRLPARARTPTPPPHRHRPPRRRRRRRPCRRLHRGRPPGGLPRHRRRRA